MIQQPTTESICKWKKIILYPIKMGASPFYLPRSTAMFAEKHTAVLAAQERGSFKAWSS